jgi:hypothetical protein
VGEAVEGEGAAFARVGLVQPRRLIDLGRTLMRRAVGPDALLAVTQLPEDDAVLVAHTVRGGRRVPVARDESVLFAGSAAPPPKAIEVFRSGCRSPLSRRPGDRGPVSPPATRRPPPSI